MPPSASNNSWSLPRLPVVLLISVLLCLCCAFFQVLAVLAVLAQQLDQGHLGLSQLQQLQAAVSGLTAWLWCSNSQSWVGLAQEPVVADDEALAGVMAGVSGVHLVQLQQVAVAAVDAQGATMEVGKCVHVQPAWLACCKHGTGQNRQTRYTPA